MVSRRPTLPRWLARDIAFAVAAICVASWLPGGRAEETAETEPEEWYFVVLRYGAITVLIMMSALFSGLTLGLLGLDLNELKVCGGAWCVWCSKRRRTLTLHAVGRSSSTAAPVRLTHAMPKPFFPCGSKGTCCYARCCWATSP